MICPNCDRELTDAAPCPCGHDDENDFCQCEWCRAGSTPLFEREMSRELLEKLEENPKEKQHE